MGREGEGESITWTWEGGVEGVMRDRTRVKKESIAELDVSGSVRSIGVTKGDEGRGEHQAVSEMCDVRGSGR